MNKRIMILLGVGAAATVATFTWVSNSGYEASYNAPTAPVITAPPSTPVTPPPNTGPKGPQCGHYPGSVYTVTTLHLGATEVQQGQSNAATVQLETQAKSTPEGFAGVTIQSTDGGDSQQLLEPLEGGKAEVSLPSDLAAGSYTVRANYLPTKCSSWASPQTGETALTVTGQ
jgi:hypothetical protein